MTKEHKAPERIRAGDFHSHADVGEWVRELEAEVTEAAKIKAALRAAGIQLNPIADGGGSWHYEASQPSPDGAASVTDALRPEAEFLCDRLTEFEHSLSERPDTDPLFYEWHGHVQPALARLRRSLSLPAPQAKYCTCERSKTSNPCIVCGKPKFIDPEWLKRKLETDPDEGAVEALASENSPAQVSEEAAPLGGSTTAYSRDQLAKLAYVTFYSPVLCAPQNIAAVAKEIDCCPGCDNVTNGGTCRVSDNGGYCPNDLAETLRQISVALYGPGDPSHYVASVFGPDKVTALSAQDAPSASLAGWREITEDDCPPNDTEVLMGCWQTWPDPKWLVEFGLYGSTKGGWIHGRMTHWLPASFLPTAPSQESRS